MRARPTTHIVLIVEDEPIVRSSIVGEFEAQGWSVVDTASAEAALVLAAEHDIDVLFTDIQLAGPLNGWDLAEKMRANRPDMPIVYTSANAPDRARRLPGSLFFGKPYNSVDVTEACASLA